ncbi:MAG: hypothetical protein ABIJ28_02870 [Patescibacteria group bacterium]
MKGQNFIITISDDSQKLPKVSRHLAGEQRMAEKLPDGNFQISHEVPQGLSGNMIVSYPVPASAVVAFI